MIVVAFFAPVVALIKSIVGMMPQVDNVPAWIGDATILLSKGIAFFGADIWYVIMANVGFWLTVQFGWSVIEWVYKKIPGVD